jgi:hypothetical protein
MGPWLSERACVCNEGIGLILLLKVPVGTAYFSRALRGK